MLLGFLLYTSPFPHSLYAQAQGFECQAGEGADSGGNTADLQSFSCSILDVPQAEVPEITIYVNIHFIGTPNGNFYPGPENDWSAANGNKYAKAMVAEANSVLSNLQPSPTSLADYTGPAKYHYEFYPDPNDLGNPNIGIWFWETTPTSFPHEGYVLNVIMDNELLNPNDPNRDEPAEISVIRGKTQFGSSEVYLTNAYNIIFYGFPGSGAWRYGRLLNHEAGHIPGLCHAYACNDVCQGVDLDGSECINGQCAPGICGNNTPSWCQPTLSGSSNIMGYNEVNNAFTPCQWERIYTYFMGVQPDYVRSPDCASLGTDIVIASGTNAVWDRLRFINGKVVVETGASLTVTCELRMGEQASFEVQRGARLDVDGAKLTSWCKGTRWKGIQVWGNTNKVQPNPDGPLAADDAGVLRIRNNSTIENAQNAIRTLAQAQTWPAYKDYFGGVVVAEDSRFVNNRRVVEFMQYPAFGSALPETNKSKFVNCEFVEEGDWANNTIGITIWDCHGISFENNRFLNLDMSGITGIDYDAIISSGNEFAGCSRGIESFATFPFSSSIVVGEEGSTANVFTENNIHILSLASSFGDGLQVVNNNFFTAQYGLWLEGESRYLIEKNDFNDEYAGVVCLNTGLQHNFINCNEITAGTQYGIGVFGKNGWEHFRGLQFRGNDFTTSTTDIYVGFYGEAGSPRPHIFRANNCFTSGTANIFAPPAETNTFNYYCDFSTGANPCLEPQENLTTGGTNNYFMFDWQGTVCAGGVGSDFAPPPYSELDLTNVRNEISLLEADLPQNPGNLTILQRLSHLYEYEDHIRNWLVSDAISSRDWVTVEHILQNESSVLAQRQLFTVKVLQNDLAAAQVVLNQLPNERIEDQYFKQIQAINLERIQAGTNFVLSEAHATTLYAIAHSDSPERSYARSLLVFLRDVRFEYEFTGSAAEQESRRKWEEGPSTVEIYPNPAQDRINLNVPKGFSYFEIIDLNGRPQHRNQLDAESVNQVQLNTANWQPGLYTIQFFATSGSVVTERMVIIK